jgi:uracil-DNA glycosylase family 4
MINVNKKRKFEILVENVERCDLCKRMVGRYKVLSEKNGNIDSKVVFIGEAPGRLGADRTQIPFYGDKAGKNFEHLLNAANLTREEVFITNAVLCNPRDEKGNNAAPSWGEVWNCSLHLNIVLELIQPEIIVPLGQWALNALNVISPHSLELRRDVRKPVKWTRYIVLPMYHPGPRVTFHRSFDNQVLDFFVLSEILGIRRSHPYRKKRQQLPLFESFNPSLAQKIIFNIVKQLGTVSKFKLTKLLYLLDWQEVKNSGKVLTGCYYIFQKDGPLATELSHVLDEMEGYEISFCFRGRIPTYSLGRNIRGNIELPSNILNKINSILTQYGTLTNAEIKTKAYLTDPIKTMLRRRRKGERILNHPIFEGWISPQSK